MISKTGSYQIFLEFGKKEIVYCERFKYNLLREIVPLFMKREGDKNDNNNAILSNIVIVGVSLLFHFTNYISKFDFAPNERPFLIISLRLSNIWKKCI